MQSLGRASTAIKLMISTSMLISACTAFGREICCDFDAPCSACLRDSTVGTLFSWSTRLADKGGPDREAPLVTDRPDFTESSSTVGLGVAQVEMGYTFLLDDDRRVESRIHSWGEPLLRYGVCREWLELRLGLFPVTDQETAQGQTVTTSGLEDMYAGLKIGLTPQSGCRPEMALIPQMFVPIGSSAFSADEVLPGVNWTYSWNILDHVSLAGSTQFNRRKSASGEAYTRWAQSLSLGYALTDDWRAYSEWFALIPHSSDAAKPQHYLNGGFTYLLSDDVQWDIRAGIGVNDEAFDFFCGTGLSLRFR